MQYMQCTYTCSVAHLHAVQTGRGGEPSSGAVQYMTHSPVGARCTFGSWLKDGHTSPVRSKMAVSKPLGGAAASVEEEAEVEEEEEAEAEAEDVAVLLPFQVAWTTWLFVHQLSMPQWAFISLAHLPGRSGGRAHRIRYIPVNMSMWLMWSTPTKNYMQHMEGNVWTPFPPPTNT